jgi:hypothetical protein
MIDYLRARVTQVWLLLVFVTVLSLWLSSGQFAPGGTHHLRYTIGLAVVLVGFIKVRFVIRYFMEARSAPWQLRFICDGWLVIVFVSIVSLYSFRFW